MEGWTICIADFRCLSCFAQVIMSQKSVELHFYISTAEIFSKRRRPPWLLGRSNFLHNKSHIVGRSFPSINTGSLSFLQSLHCSRHQSHPIRCLVTVPLLKTDPPNPHTPSEIYQPNEVMSAKAWRALSRTSAGSLGGVSTSTQAGLVRCAL